MHKPKSPCTVATARNVPISDAQNIGALHGHCGLNLFRTDPLWCVRTDFGQKRGLQQAVNGDLIDIANITLVKINVAATYVF